MSRRKPKPHGASRGAAHGSPHGPSQGGSPRHQHRQGAVPSQPATGRQVGEPVDDPRRIYGRHAIAAALANERRRVVAIRHTPEAAGAIASLLDSLPAQRRAALPGPQPIERADLDAALPPGAVHQGMALEVEPLADVTIDDLIVEWDGRADVLVVVLDQVTDPHNVGAVLRSAAAFGAAAVLMQDRHGPPVTGTLAKSASGALDVVPLVRVVNLARSLRDLQECGFWCTGLAEEGTADLGDVDLAGRCALVLGAEGSGLRRLTRDTCDALARLPTDPPIGSLNVSAAAAVALYQARLARRDRNALQSVKK
ncbi:MAG: 23S rRNA (guanosine(2251)-2'-O)-methyltransferase RlmB [Alphaproteobacteria bacterium]|nr:23S rRNA (guanosine(2251)-2'-O)-methyltransferase RlmB [Alphaproteobacteria bacterium]